MLRVFVRRRFSCGIREVTALSLFVWSLLPPSVLAYELELKRVAATIADGLTRSGRKSVAVVDCTDLQGQANELGRFLAEQLSVLLATDTSSIDVVDRTHLSVLLREHRLSTTGLMDASMAKKLGQIAGVDAIVTGSMTPFGDSVNVAFKALDVRTARVLAAAVVDIPKTAGIVAILNRSLTSQEPGESAAASSASSAVAAGSDAHPPPLKFAGATARVAMLTLNLIQCQKGGTSVSCEGRVVSNGDKTVEFSAGSGSYVVDDLGNRARETAIYIGAQGIRTQPIEPQVPVKFLIDAQGLSPAATSATVVLEVPGWVIGRGFGPWNSERVTFRNIPFEGS